MPIYEYKCSQCGGTHAEMRPMAQREALAKCPKCGGSAKFRVSQPGRFRRGPGWGARMDGARMPGRVE